MKFQQAFKSRWAWITASVFLIQSYLKFQYVAMSFGVDMPFISTYNLFIFVYGFIFGLGLEKLFKG